MGGMLPAWDPHLLPTGQSADSTNAYLFSGGLIGWRAPKLLRALNNSAATMAYRVPTITQGTASGMITVGGSNVNPGDSVLVGEDTYTFTAAVTKTSLAYSVLVGANAAASAANLFAAITLDQGLSTGEGTTYSLGTCVNNAVSQVVGVNTLVGTIINLVAPDVGYSYNSTVFSENTSGARITISGATFTGGQNASVDTDITGAASWLEFVDPDTNVMRSPVVDDRYDRYYFVSPSQPPQYNTHDRITGAQPPWLLGVPAPGCAPGVSVTGGGAATLGNVTGNSALTQFPATIPTNSMVLIPVTPGATPFTLNSIAIMPASNDQYAEITAVLYDASGAGGGPGNLLNTGVPTSTTDITTAAAQAAVTAAVTAQFAIDPTAAASAISAALANTTYSGMLQNIPFVSLFANAFQLAANTPFWIGLMFTSTFAQTIAAEQARVPIIPPPTPPDTFYIVDTGTQGNITSLTYSNPPPVTAPTMTTGQPDWQMWGIENADNPASSILEDRAYVYTWVTEYGEEGPPSPPINATGWSNGTWTITMFPPTADEMGVTRNIKWVNVYRTVSAVGGVSTYFLLSAPVPPITPVIGSPQVGMLPATTVSYVDSIPDSTVALNRQLPSTNWYPPPEGLEGIMSMPNGMAVGFMGNEVWFCEPYRPHAWPPGYVITTEFPIVGVGVIGQSAVICTEGHPYVATGVNPSVVTLAKVLIPEPCISRGSVLSGPTAVYYVSHNGLISVDQNGNASNTTELWITRDKWNILTPGKNLRTVLLASSYFCFGTVNGSDHSVAQQGFTIELNTGDAASFTIWPQPGGHRLGFQKMTAPGALDIYNLQVDPWTGIAMLIQNGNIYYYDFTDQAPTITPYNWWSKIYQQTYKHDFAAFRVWFTVPPGSPALAPTRTETNTIALSANMYAVVRVYADVDGTGNMMSVTEREVRKPGELLRIKSGFKCEMWQFQIEGRVLISNMQVATSVKELGGV